MDGSSVVNVFFVFNLSFLREKKVKNINITLAKGKPPVGDSLRGSEDEVKASETSQARTN